MSKNKQTAEQKLVSTGVFGPFPGVFGAGINTASPVEWTTEAWNRSAYLFFMSQLESIAMARFRWVNLPPKVDARFLEWVLLVNGYATISWPQGLLPLNAFAMQAILGTPNGNMEYTDWRAQGYNGVGWPATPENGVILWNDLTRLPLIPNLQFIASECANIVRTKQTVRQHMRQPVLITAPREMSQQLHNVMTAAANGEPYILAYDRFATDVAAQVMPMSSGNEASELGGLQGDLKDVWNLGLAALGIDVNERKAERQSVPEIQQTSEPTSAIALSALMARRTACEQLNKLTGLETGVYWNQDVETASFNAMNNLETLLQAPQGDAIIGGETA